MKTKKAGSTGRYGTRYGRKIRRIVLEIEQKQKKKQKCPYCQKLNAKRLAKGLWECTKCHKKFTGGAYFLE